MPPTINALTQYNISNALGSQGSPATVAVQVNACGLEVAFSFSLSFDPSILNNPRVRLGQNISSGAVLTVNPNVSGRLGILVDNDKALFGGGDNLQALIIDFDVLPTAPSGLAKISFVNSPAGVSTSDPNGNLLPSEYADGYVAIGVSPPKDGPNYRTITNMSILPLPLPSPTVNPAPIIITSQDCPQYFHRVNGNCVPIAGSPADPVPSDGGGPIINLDPAGTNTPLPSTIGGIPIKYLVIGGIAAVFLLDGKK